MHRRHVVRRLGALAAVAGFGLLGTSLQGQKPAPKADATFTLMVFFDGGYAVDFDKNTVIDVHAINSAAYPMKANVMTNAATTVIDLTTFEAALLPDGTAPTPAKPKMPPYNPGQTGCKFADITLPNNRFFIPSLTQIAGIMSTSLAVAPKSTLHLTGGGEVSVRRVGGCVEFRDGYDVAIPDIPIRSMVSGRAGLLYEWRDIPARKLVLQKKPLGGGLTTTTDIMPNGDGLIVLWMSHQEIPRERRGILTDGDMKIAYEDDLCKPHDLKFGDHFSKAFGSYDDRKFRLWWLGCYDTSPGIDCPTGGIP
jgi:hypothetical protein